MRSGHSRTVSVASKYAVRAVYVCVCVCALFLLFTFLSHRNVYTAGNATFSRCLKKPVFGKRITTLGVNSSMVQLRKN